MVVRKKSSGEQKRKEGLNEEGDGAADVKWQEGWESLNGRDLRRRPSEVGNHAYGAMRYR